MAARWRWPRAPHHGPAGPMHMACLPLPLGVLLLPLLSQLAITAHAKTLNVGGDTRTWQPYTDFSFQSWADGIYWNNGDVLTFVYNRDLHDVWMFEDQASFSSCDFSGRNLYYYSYATSIRLIPDVPGTNSTIYFGSSIYDDCASYDMKFSLTYYTCYSCASGDPYSDPSPPPPPRIAGPPQLGYPTPSYWSGSSEDSKKTSVPAVAIAVPIVVVVVLGAGVVGLCCVCRARRRDEADVGPSKPPPPGSPVLAFQPAPASPPHSVGPSKPPPPDSPVLAFQPAPASPPHSPVLAFQPAPVPVVVPGPPPPVFNGRPPLPAPNGVHGFGPTSATTTPVLAV